MSTRDHSLFQIPGQTLSDEPSSTDTALRTLHPNVYDASAAYTHSNISDRPSLMEDIENCQIDNLRETPGGAGLLYWTNPGMNELIDLFMSSKRDWVGTTPA